MSKPLLSCDSEIEIPFHDVDMMEVAWHGHYSKYLEIARSKLLDMIDYNYPQMRDSGYAWPIIELHIRYAQPLLFQQHIRINAALTEVENRLKIDYTFYDAQTDKRLTKAHTVQVAVNMATGEMQFASPAALTDKLKSYLS